MLVSVNDHHGTVSSSRSGSWMAFGLVLIAHLAVFAGLRQEPKPLPLETIPEPILVSLVSLPQATLKRNKRSANFERKAPIIIKPKVSEQRTIKHQARQIPSTHEKSVNKPLVVLNKNIRDAAVSSVEPITAPVAAATSPPDADAAKTAIEQSDPGEPSDQAAGFNAAYLNNPAPELEN